MRETAIFSFAIATVATIIARKIFHDWCWHLSMVNLANQKLSQNTFWKRWNLLAKGGMIFTLEGFKCSCYCLSLFTSKSEIKFGRSLLNLIGNKARGSSRRGFHNPGGWYDPCRWCTTFSKQFSPTECQFELRPISEILFILQFRFQFEAVDFLPWWAFWNASFQLESVNSVWPDLAIYWTLGKFLKSLATIYLPEPPTFLGNFCNGVKMYNFSSEIIFEQLL